MTRTKLLSLILIPVILIGVFMYYKEYSANKAIDGAIPNISQIIEENIKTEKTHPLQIEEMRKQNYPGSEITIEQNLGIKNNYNQYIVSYLSDGHRINALMTIPIGEKPQDGWPVIIFNHGYIPPEQYRTTERYVAYVDGFARNGYIVFKSDYRGHGSSEGEPDGAYYSTAYTVDVLNALESMKKHADANPNKIGMWGHSMGGNITLRSMVVSKDIKAGVVWGGVVASYQDMANNWRRTSGFTPSRREDMARRPTRTQIIQEFGTFEQNPEFWKSISPIFWVKDISGPMQIHHGLNDETVPWEFSESLNNALVEANKSVEYYTYPGADHDISSPSFETAIKRSVEFFDKHLK